MHHKLRSYDVWFLRYKAIMGHFLPFDTPSNGKNQNFEKIKKTLGDTIWWVTTIWCMVPEISSATDNFLSFWTNFYPRYVTYVIVIFHLGLIFALLQPKKSKAKSKTARKIKISKKMKKTSGDVIILHMCTINYD